MKEILTNYIKSAQNLGLGNQLFLLGIFFLPSALPIGALFLLISAFFSFQNKKNIFINDIWDKLFLVCIFLILISTFSISFINTPSELVDFNKFVVWLNLFNWLPIIALYFGFKNYLINREQKVLFEKYLISGTIPILASCILQKFFNLYGPFETLFGSIIWFNRTTVGPITGLFNNPNYLGLWLTLCLPFSIMRLQNEKRLNNKIFLSLINILILYFTLETHSRNALIGIAITCLFIFNLRKVIIFSFFSIIGILLIVYLPPILLDIQTISFFDFSNDDLRIVNGTLDRFKSTDPNFLNYPRILIFKRTISLILERPFLGWGGATFSHLYSQKQFYLVPYRFIHYQHSHNLILELAYNFGIPLSFLYTFNVSTIFLKSLKKTFSFKSFSFLHNNKPWVAAFAVFLFSQMYDLTYYDGRISLLSCILFSGIKNSIYETQAPKNLIIKRTK